VLVAGGMRLLAAAAALASGCGTSILLSYPTHLPFFRAHNEIVTSTRVLEDPVRTTVARIETGPLRVACETTTEFPKVEATISDTYDGVGRFVCGSMAFGEGMIATAIALSDKDRTQAIVAASLVGADAIGALVYAIAARSSAVLRTEVGPGLPDVSQTCAAGLVVRAGAQRWAVKPDGSLDGDARAFASAAVANQPIAIASGGVEVPWSPGARDRCALVGQFGVDDPSGTCAQPTALVPEPVPVVTPLEIRIRIPRSRPAR
jgi:hypothetical protein